MEIEGNIEFLEFVFVLLTILISLAILVVFGKFWSA